MCRFASGGDDWYVLVGVARDMILNPRSVAGGFIYTYRLTGGGEKLEFMHKVSAIDRGSEGECLDAVEVMSFSCLFSD